MVTAGLGAKRQRRPGKRSFFLEHSVTTFSPEVKVVVTVIAVHLSIHAISIYQALTVCTANAQIL